MTSKKQTNDDYVSEIISEFARRPPSWQAAAIADTERMAHQESTLVREMAFASPDPKQFVIDSVATGVPGAMLLMGRECAYLGKIEEAQAWNIRAYDAGSAEAGYMLGMKAVEAGNIPAAFEFFKTAVNRKHGTACFALANLCRDFTSDEVRVNQEEFSELEKISNAVSRQLMMAEALDILGEGTHPVQYRDSSGIPWGTGTLFMVRWKEIDLAITAKHVIGAAYANPNQVHIVVHQQEQSLHVEDDIALEFRDSDGEPLDVHIWRIKTNVEQALEWNSWKLEEFCKSAKELPENSSVFVVGFPNTEDKVDFDAKKMHRAPLVVKGRLGPAYAGLYSIACAEFSVDVDGVSGGPVFYKHGGVYYFIGISQWGGTTARKLYFLDSSEIIRAIGQFLDRSGISSKLETSVGLALPHLDSVDQR